MSLRGDAAPSERGPARHLTWSF